MTYDRAVIKMDLDRCAAAAKNFTWLRRRCSLWLKPVRLSHSNGVIRRISRLTTGTRWILMTAPGLLASAASAQKARPGQSLGQNGKAQRFGCGEPLNLMRFPAKADSFLTFITMRTRKSFSTASWLKIVRFYLGLYDDGSAAGVGWLPPKRHKHAGDSLPSDRRRSVS